MIAAPVGAVLRAALTCDDRKRTSGRRTAPPLRKRLKVSVHAKGTKMEKSRSLWLRDSVIYATMMASASWGSML